MRYKDINRSSLRIAQACQTVIVDCWNTGRQRRQFEADFAKMRSLAEQVDKRFLLEREHCYPCFGDATSSPSFGEYFFHLAWAARELQKINPENHYDFSSHNFFLG